MRLSLERLNHEVIVDLSFNLLALPIRLINVVVNTEQ